MFYSVTLNDSSVSNERIYILVWFCIILDVQYVTWLLTLNIFVKICVTGMGYIIQTIDRLLTYLIDIWKVSYCIFITFYKEYFKILNQRLAYNLKFPY